MFETTYMKPKKPKPNASNTMMILVVISVIVTVVLCVLAIFSSSYKENMSLVGPNTNYPAGKSDANTNDTNPKQKDNDYETGSGKTEPRPEDGEGGQATDSRSQANNGQGTSNSASPNQPNTTQSVICSEENGDSCVLIENGSFASNLDINPFVSGVTINGQNVPILKISHMFTYKTQSNNTVSDANGRTLASSLVSYDESKKELIVVIGVDKIYYEKLTFSEQRTFYVSQLVRAIFSVTGEAASNYPKVASAVSKLSYWNPNTDQ